jgi:hypothetical protein
MPLEILGELPLRWWSSGTGEFINPLRSDFQSDLPRNDMAGPCFEF